jgi:hypothetical protein
MACGAGLPTGGSSYRRLHIYSTKARIYIVGHDESKNGYRFLKLRRQDGPLLETYEDPATYSPEESNKILAKIHELSGGLQLVCKVSWLNLSVQAVLL